MGRGELLRTKLVAPPPRPRSLPRTALVDRLRAATAPGLLTLVVAGAGWGKSTLVASWARAEQDGGARVAWFSVDATDDDPVRFWDHVAAALSAAVPGSVERATALLGLTGTSTVTDVVPVLTNELAALDGPVTLVVDDYHLIGTGEVHEGVGRLVGRLPGTLRLVLVSRTEPPLPLARLRGRGRLAELGAADLRLSPDETAALLDGERAAGAGWTPADARRVHARTEGWVAGLHLAVLSRRARAGGPAAAVGTVPGGAPHLAEYLRTEVLDPLPGDVRTFLRRTAVLDRFSADLAVAVSGQADGAALLARADRDQLFVVALDDVGRWFRYHHLFADVLRDDLARAEAPLVPLLHTRAARWHAQHGDPVDAVRHALLGDDPALATDLVAAHAPAVIRAGQVGTASAWFGALGDDVCSADARLATARALAAAHGGRPQEIPRWTAAAERAVTASPSAPPAIRIAVASSRWMAATYDGDATAALRAAEEAVRLLPDAPGSSRAAVLFLLGVSRYRAGSLDAAGRIFAEVESVADGRDEHLAAASARGMRAWLAAELGRHGEAEDLARTALRRAERYGLAEHAITATAHRALGLVALAVSPRRAAPSFRQALRRTRRSGLTVEVAELLAALALADDRLGRHDSARRLLTEARSVLDGRPDPGHLYPDPRTVRLTGTAPAAEATAGLSPRQAEILRLLADDLTSAGIAEHLGLSPRTVDAHLRALYRKLGVRTRSAATRYAVEHGVLTTPDDTPTTGSSSGTDG